MKRRFFYWLLVIIIVFTTLSGVKAVYASNNPYYDNVYKKYVNSLSTQQEMQLEEWSYWMYDGMYQEYYDQWICSGVVWEEVVEILLNEGYYVEYFDEIKANGWVRDGYKLHSTSNNSTTATIITEKKSISVTTTKCDEKIMWAKSQVNVRENGSTDYKKVGSLQANEQVTVTGIDSTGWYEIRKSDGTVGHVSDKYLTEEDPSANALPEEETNEETSKRESQIISIDGRTVVWYNSETEEEEEVVFSDNTPLEEVEDMAMKYLINGAELVEQPTEETTPTEEITETEEVKEELSSVETEPVVEETMKTPSVEEPIEVEDDTEEPKNNTDKTREFVQGPIFIFGSIILGLIAFIGGIVVIIVNRKKR